MVTAVVMLKPSMYYPYIIMRGRKEGALLSISLSVCRLHDVVIPYFIGLGNSLPNGAENVDNRQKECPKIFKTSEPKQPVSRIP